MTSQDEGIFSCRNMCWIAAALFGLAVFMLMNGLVGLNLIVALIIGLVLMVGLALLLQNFFCSGNTESSATPHRVHDVAATKDAVADVGHAGQSGLATTPHMPAAEPEVHSADLAEPAPAIPDAPAAAVDGTRPEALSAPRDGQADDLKKIKGVGPKLEVLLNSLGFYHFDQVAGWSAAEVAWVDENLKGFKGRVSRDGWVEQAKLLAAGVETEFSKRVQGGNVYE